MRLAMISDVHGNLPALEAVLADISAAGLDQIWCLGDVVGYGAQPQECADIVAERADLCLVGNHDLAVIGALDIAAFSPAAAAAVRWTQENVNDSALEFLRGLKPSNIDHEVGLYHASPRDPVWEYVLWPDQAAECIAAQARRVSFVGHSHVALFFVVADEDTLGPGEVAQSESRGAQVGAGTTLDVTAGRWLLNPGSVGQPRDADPRAAWLELDTDLWTASYRRVDYEIERAAAAITAAGLPEQLARRLHVGQ